MNNTLTIPNKRKFAKSIPSLKHVLLFFLMGLFFSTIGVSAETNTIPETTPPDRPNDYCWRDTNEPYSPQPNIPPQPFLYQPFDMDWSGDIWSSVMDHNQPTYVKNNLVATLGENLTSSPTSFGKFTYYWSPSLETDLGYDGHDGHDFKTGRQAGIAALAAAGGWVVRTNNLDSGALGKYVDIYHPMGSQGQYLTRYAHLENVYVNKTNPLTWVASGDEIGEIGTTGNSTGIHLHFSVYRWNAIRNKWEITDPFGWDPWLSPASQISDPLYFCNGEVSYDLWVGGFPQRVNGATNGGVIPTGDGIGGWLEVEDELPPPLSHDQASFIADITIPDGTAVSPGESLIKTWRVRNSGTSTWDGYTLVFQSGNQMGASSSVNIPHTVPGQEVDISIQIQAPDHSSTGNWHIVNPAGTHVQGGSLWVSLVVEDETNPPPPPSNFTLECLTETCLTTVEPGQSFRPTVRATIGNGQLLESRGDMLRHKSGDLFGAWPQIAVVGSVTNYDFVFSADNPITAPTTNGTYQTTWQLWQNGQWVGPELIITFEVQTGGGANHPPTPPTLTDPGDWAVFDGTTPTLKAQHNGDPDGDAVNE